MKNDYTSLIAKKIITTKIDDNDSHIALTHADKICIPNEKDLSNLPHYQAPPTDFALMCGALQNAFSQYKSLYDFMPVSVMRRNDDAINEMNSFRLNTYYSLTDDSLGIRPFLKIRLPQKVSLLSLKKEEKYSRSDVKKLFSILKTLSTQIGKNEFDKDIYHTIEFGRYPKTKVSQIESETLEKLFKGNKLKSTGLTYTTLKYDRTLSQYYPVQIPEFEYENKFYVRTIAHNLIGTIYQDNTIQEKADEIKWVRVEPIKYRIVNWNELPKFVNPNGNNTAQTLDLITEKAILSGIPFYNVDTPRGYVNYSNSMVRGFLNGLDFSKSFDDRFCKSLDFSKFGGFLNEALNEKRSPKYEYEITNSDVIVGDYSFAGCKHLRQIFFPNNISNISKKAFIDCKFNVLKNVDTKFALSTETETNTTISIKDIEDIFDNDYVYTIKNFYACKKYINIMNHTKTKIPFDYISKMNAEELSDFSESNFKFFNSTIAKTQEYKTASNEEKSAILKLGRALGLFNDKNMTDDNGNITNTLQAQKASSLLITILKEYISPGKLEELLKDETITKSNQNLLKFLSKSENKRLNKLEMLLNLEKNHKGIFCAIIKNFNEAKAFRIDLVNGVPKTIPWDEAFKRFFYFDTDLIQTARDIKIAEQLNTNNVSKTTISKISEMLYEAEDNNVPHNILGKELKEKTILQEIEDIKENTKQLLGSAKEKLENICNKQFTYEFLDKYDPRNAVIGLYCSCCANITSQMYGYDIASASILHPNVQNLVIKDINNDIIAKGTMYINKKLGYAVLNDFEINEKYKKYQLHGSAGYYSNKTPSEKAEDQARQQILLSFKRGINDFVKEYDKQNADNPIKIVTVGMGYNRLSEYIDYYDQPKTKLETPTEISFEDAEEEQRILYLKDDIKKETNNEQQR